MSNESRFEGGDPRGESADEHSDTLEQLLGQIRGKLLLGTYDVLKGHHEDVLEITSGDHRHEHRLTQHEANMIEQAIWSAGEDQTLGNLIHNIHVGLKKDGFKLEGNDIDVTIKLREGAPDS